MMFFGSFPAISKGFNHGFISTFDHFFQSPVVTVAILNPFIIRNRNAAAIGENIRDDNDAFVLKNLVGISSSRAIGTFHYQLGFYFMNIMLSNLVFQSTWSQQINIQFQQIFIGNAFRTFQINQMFSMSIDMRSEEHTSEL